MHVVATAGHVDHGKSTLVKALTGTDPDRFAEEKQRGLTIDLGFAAATLPSGREVAFVDVPGHIRFIKNMLAGVGAVDACLFVVAATEGWKPQSEEHLRILELLGVGHGMVALTKAALVDDEWRELARLDIADHLAGTFLDGAPVVAVDAIAGAGLDALTAALDTTLAATPTAADRGRPRLWIDRAFAAAGAGTVVTGTLAGGALAVDDELAVVPGGRSARVRGLQTHSVARTAVGPGHRVAVNLTGIAHGQVARGQALIRAGQWEPTRRLDATLEVLAALDHPVTRRGAYRAYIGSGEHDVRLRVLGSEALAPGSTGCVRLHLPVTLPLLPGDRYVLRESGRGETVGGGAILDVAPVLPASKAAPDGTVDRVVAERGWVEVSHLERLTGVASAPAVGRWAVSPAALAAAETEVRAALTAAGAEGIDLAGLTDQQRAVLATLDGIALEHGRAWAAEARPAGGGEDHPWLGQLRASPFAPPPPGECGASPQEVRGLVRRGLVVEQDGAWFAKEAVDAAADAVARLLAASPEGVTVAQVRDVLGTTRKHVLPLLAQLDATGITRRRGDLRIGGPRLPAAPGRGGDDPGKETGRSGPNM